MARFARIEVLTAMVETGLVPVFYHSDVQQSRNIVEACAAGGARLGAYAYEFAVRLGRRLHSFEVADGSIPSCVAPLIHQLQTLTTRTG